MQSIPMSQFQIQKKQEKQTKNNNRMKHILRLSTKTPS